MRPTRVSTSGQSQSMVCLSGSTVMRGLTPGICMAGGTEKQQQIHRKDAEYADLSSSQSAIIYSESFFFGLQRYCRFHHSGLRLHWLSRRQRARTIVADPHGKIAEALQAKEKCFYD